MSKTRVRFYTRSGCHLCDQLFPFLQENSHRLGLKIELVDIDQEPELLSKHGDWVPVVEIDGRVVARGIISRPMLLRALKAASMRPPPARTPLRIGVAIVFNEQGEMLVNKRPEGSYFGGWWEWPGGKCELGETPLACAERELKEEIGVQASDWQLYRRQKSLYPEREVRLHFFRAKLVSASIAGPEALEHRWLAPNQVEELKFLEANLDVLHSFSQNSQK